MQNRNIVIKKIADSFWVKTDDKVIKAKPRGGLKKIGVLVGDEVAISFENDDCLIEKVEKRKNQLIRPPLANLEQLVIVIANEPSPDYLIVDKLILFAYSYDIEPIIVVNKTDQTKDIFEYVQKVYSSFIKTLDVSAKTGKNLDKLKNVLGGKISAFAGQSAVGKSALVNALLGQDITKEGELSQRIGRGKNTTRHTEIYCHEDIMIADTAGFSALDETLLPIPYFELTLYYPDFLQLKTKCKYPSCSHNKESVNDCFIKQSVKNGNLDRERYLRYKKIYEILQEKWVKTHG